MRRGPAFALAALLLAVDQAVKAWLHAAVLAPHKAIPVTGFCNLVLVWNRGVSFGLLGDAERTAGLIAAVTALVIAALAVWLWRAPEPRVRLALGLVLGGALGNLVDRLRFGAVLDFLDLHAFGYHWPAFNVADAAITVGAAVLVADALLAGRGGQKEKE